MSISEAMKHTNFRKMIVGTLREMDDYDTGLSMECDRFLMYTPWSKAHLEKLTGFQLVKKFPAFCGTGRFITAFITARHLSLT